MFSKKLYFLKSLFQKIFVREIKIGLFQIFWKIRSFRKNRKVFQVCLTGFSSYVFFVFKKNYYFYIFLIAYIHRSFFYVQYTFSRKFRSFKKTIPISTNYYRKLFQRPTTTFKLSFYCYVGHPVENNRIINIVFLSYYHTL